MQTFGMKKMLSERFSKKASFKKKNDIVELSKSRLDDLRKLDRTMALKTFEFLSDDPEAVLKLCSEDEENIKPLHSKNDIIVSELKQSDCTSQSSSEKKQLLSI